MYVQDTIAAISTPLGEGGVGIIRVSGPAAEEIGSRIFPGRANGGFQSHLFYYGRIKEPESGEVIDEALVVLMRAPRSYTREDVLEIHCHGGYLVVHRVLQLVLAQGARLAQPGEFTKRAFLNGRIDLVQAEAVIDVIRSKTDASLSLAQRQREGALSVRINRVRTSLRHALALVEAFIDFPEEEIDPVALAGVEQHVGEACSEIDELLAVFDEGRVLREGVKVLIAGKPNVGKSSLLNTLLREKRAIVTAIPGTTRDLIEEVVNMQGLPVSLMDTAGIRDTEDLVELEGVRLTLEKIPEADLVLFMVDGSRPFEAEDRSLLAALVGKRMITVINKCDLPQHLSLPAEVSGHPLLRISTKTGEGVELLKEMIVAQFFHGHALDSREFVSLTRSRHRDALLKSRDLLHRFGANLAIALDLELLAVDLRDALAAVGEVTGETTPDDILDLIFASFCIGK